MVGTRRLEELASSVEQRLRMPAGDLTVALSGGADSATLAFLCHRIGRSTTALHVNHALPHSKKLEKAAVRVADSLGMDLVIRHTTVPDGASPEGQARAVRYGEFAEVSTDSEALLTAHTLDDNVETVVFNLIRGTGQRGLGGIPHFRDPNIYRPMLEITASETREIAGLAGLPFMEDPMNSDMSLTRNVIRSRVVPMLSGMNPRFIDSVSRMTTTVLADVDYLDGLAAAIPRRENEDSIAVAIGDLVAAPTPVRDRVIKSIIAKAVGEGGVTAERVATVWDVGLGGGSSQLAGLVVAAREGALLVLRWQSHESRLEPRDLDPGRHRVGSMQFEVASFDVPCRVAPLSRWQAIFPIGTQLTTDLSGSVKADGELAWIPGVERHPVAWYESGSVGYLSVFASEV